MRTVTSGRTASVATERSRDRLGWWVRIAGEGVVAGTFGAVIVALWYLLCDSMGGRPFHTPALLGAIIFNGLRGHDIGAITLAPVLSFTVLHLVAFIAFGLASALVIAAAEREPLLALGALMVYGCYEVCFLAFVSALDASALGAIGWWKIATANVITLMTMFGYFQYRHPQILSRFNERWDDFDAGELAAQPRVAAHVVPLSQARLSTVTTGLK